MEEWKPVPGEPLLEATATGRVRRIERALDVAPRDALGRSTGNFRKVVQAGEIFQELKNGYLNIKFMVARKRQSRNVHRLIAATFVPGYFEGATVDHIDGCRTNNHATNLRWVTRSENSKLQNAAGRGVPKGEKHPFAKLKDSDIPQLFAMRAAGMTLPAIGAHFGVSGSLVHKITSGIRRKAA